MPVTDPPLTSGFGRLAALSPVPPLPLSAFVLAAARGKAQHADQQQCFHNHLHVIDPGAP
jgi:hypothetical protein